MFRDRIAAGLPLILWGCSLVIGELPGPLPADAGSGQGGGSGGATGRGGTPSEGPPDASDAGASGNGGVNESDAGDDASQNNAGDAGFNPCDRDGDGEQNAGCGGEDCDDDDRRVHPGQGEFFDQESETVGFDYNCSNTFDREYPQALTCSLEDCDTEQGFLVPLQPCGEEGEWGECVPSKPVGLMCTELVNGLRRVACH